MTRKENVVLISIGLFVLIGYVIAGFYCHPAADDFTYALKGKEGDFIQTVLQEREIWNGRYLSNFIVLFSPLNWGGLWAYQLMPGVLILLIFIGTFGFYRNIVVDHALIFTLISMLVVFGIMPDITEGIYWYTGAWTYLPSAVLFFYGFSLLIKFWSKLNVYHYFFFTIVFILVSGFNEVIPLLGILIFTVLAISTFNQRIYFKVYFFLSLFILITIYIITAPGNAIRANYFPDKHQFFYSMYMSVAYTIRFVGEWLLNPAFYLITLLILRLNFDVRVKEQFNFLKKPFFIFLVFFIPTFISCFGPLWSTGLLGQYRTANLASYMFVLAFFIVIVANQEMLKIKLKSFYQSKIIVPLLVVFLLGWKNQFYLFKEFIDGKIFQYDEDMKVRYRIIKNCNDPECYVPSIQNDSKTLFMYELQDEPNHPINRSYQLYFKTGKIIKYNP